MQTTHQTAHGQLLDITTAPIGTVDLSKYTEDTYMRIVTYKTAFYSFYLPVVCGLLVGGTTFQDAFAVAKDICIEMGRYFQVWCYSVATSLNLTDICQTAEKEPPVPGSEYSSLLEQSCGLCQSSVHGAQGIPAQS